MRSVGSVGRHLAVALLSVPAWGTPVRAQPAADLEGPALEIARSWQAGDAAGLAGRMAPDGVRLHLPDASHPALTVRLARAALEDLLGRAGRGPVAVRQVRLLGGTPQRGYVEMAWRPMASGMTEALEYTLFAGLEQRDDRWWIVELRVMARRPPDATETRITEESWR